jgi:hypothetical protein
MGSAITHVSGQALYVAPLCPVGHLPHQGGDQPATTISPIAEVARNAPKMTRVIYTLAEKVSDRTEGGAKERYAGEVHQ